MTLAERIAEKAREEFGYTTFNGLRKISVTEEKLAALIAAELEPVRTYEITEVLNEFQVWLDLARRDGYPEKDYLAVDARLAAARVTLAILEEKNERLRAFHAVAPQPEWFKDAIEGVIMPDEKWLIDYTNKYAATCPKGVGDGEARP